MNYIDAHNFIFNEIGEEGTDLLWFVAEDNVSEGITLIKKLTSCDDMIAKALWTDLKSKYGTTENNPYIESVKCNLNQQTYISNINIPHCPTCNSTNISRISTTAKVINVAMFGLLGQKRKHQFKCNDCKYEW